MTANRVIDRHSELTELDYASSDHTGFASSDDLTTVSGLVDDNISDIADNTTLIDTTSGTLQSEIDGKDNYQNWKFAVDGITKDDITSEDTLNFVGGDNITITRSADDEITVSGTTGGGGAGKVKEVGSTSINDGSNTVTVTFVDAQADINYRIMSDLVNTTDGTPSVYSYIISAVTVNGFTVIFGGDMDSANYDLHWGVAR